MQSVRILFLAANPSSTSRLALDEEVRLVSERLRACGAGDRIELRVAWAVRAQEIPGLLLHHRPQIVHFIGHGSQSGELMFVGQDAAATAPVSAETLGRIFEALRDDIRCVVMSACYSAVQAAAVAQVIPCVVGMSRAVRDDAARAFAYGFYEALAFGRGVQTAFRLGRAQTELIQVGDQREIPQLLVQAGVDAESLTLLAPAASSMPSSSAAAPISPKHTTAASGHASPQTPGARLLVCFSSQDAEGKAEVAAQLAPLLRKSAISLWSTDDIPYGASSADEFVREAERADAALLLLSASFLADSQAVEQLKILEEQHRQRGVRIIPLVWRACSWQEVDWLKPLLPAPRDGSALMGLDKPKRERELVAIISQIQIHPAREPGTASGLQARPPPNGNHERRPDAPLTQSSRPAADQASARRAARNNQPLLDCDRGEQWENLRALVGNDHHELILVPGQVGQAHRFFLDRIELALPSQPPHRVIRVDWDAPKDLTVPQFRQNRREALAALAAALDVPSASIDELPKALHAQLEEHHLVLLHPVVNRCLSEVELSQYYYQWIPELLGDSRTTYRCKLVQPVEWAAESKSLLRSVKSLLGRSGARVVLADQKQAQAFMQGVKKSMVDEAKKRKQPPVLRVTQLPELAQLLKKDVVKFLEIAHYGDDTPSPEAMRSDLADHVLAGDASSEQILQRLCRELPRDLWPSGAP